MRRWNQDYVIVPRTVLLTVYHLLSSPVACVNSTSGKLSSETIRLIVVVALVMRLNSDDCPNEMKKVVSYIERMLLFPEWKGLVDSLQLLSDEAKCQVTNFTYTAISIDIIPLIRYSEVQYLCYKPPCVIIVL